MNGCTLTPPPPPSPPQPQPTQWSMGRLRLLWFTVVLGWRWTRVWCGYRLDRFWICWGELCCTHTHACSLIMTIIHPFKLSRGAVDWGCSGSECAKGIYETLTNPFLVQGCQSYLIRVKFTILLILNNYIHKLSVYYWRLTFEDVLWNHTEKLSWFFIRRFLVWKTLTLTLKYNHYYYKYY